jgi:hypothetical protein
METSQFADFDASAGPAGDPVTGHLIGRLMTAGSTAERVAAIKGLIGRVRDALGTGREIADLRQLMERATAVLAGAVPYLPVRDANALRGRYGLTGDELATRLEQAAAETVTWIWTGEALVGMAVRGPVAHVVKVVLHTAVEVRLVAELHAVYGCQPTDDRPLWLCTALRAWAAGRPVPVGSLTGPELSAVTARLYRTYHDLRGESGVFAGWRHRRDGAERLTAAVRPFRRRLRLGAAGTLTGLPVPPAEGPVRPGTFADHVARAAALHASARAWAEAARRLAGQPTAPAGLRRASGVPSVDGPAALQAPIAELLGGTPPAGPRLDPTALVRVGVFRLPDGDAVPALVPFGAGGHLAFAGNARDPRVAGAVRAVVARMLAAAPAGALQVRVVDTFTAGELCEPFQPLAASQVMTSPATSEAGLISTFDAAHAHLDRQRDGRGAASRLILVVALSPRELDSHRDSIEGLAHAGAKSGLHLIVTGWPPALRLDHTTHVLGGDPFQLHGPQTGMAGGDGGPLAMPVEVDDPPPPGALRQWCGALAGRFEQERSVTVAGLLPATYWQEVSADGLRTPAGAAAGTVVELCFDDRTPHWLVGGRSGAGKTVFLLDVLFGLACRYAPDELALYLLDFKNGVSFNDLRPSPQDPTHLPHARILGVESDREFGVAVLRHLADELRLRSTVMKQHSVTKYQDLRACGVVVPRIVAVIDEFQVLLHHDDAIGREAADLLEHLARQGRSYGVHLLLASQTTAGVAGLLDRRSALFGQFPTRIALRGAVEVLADDSRAARLANGTFLVDHDGGVGSDDGPVSFPNAHAEGGLLRDLRRRLCDMADGTLEPPVVFEGTAVQHLADSPVFRAARPIAQRPVAWVGRGVDASLSTAGVPLDRTVGRHVAILGSRADGLGILEAMVTGLARQHEPGTATFLVAGPEPADRPGASAALVAAGGPHQAQWLGAAQLAAALARLADERPGALAGPRGDHRTYLVLSASDAVSAALAAPDADGGSAAAGLRAVLRGGPVRGIHVLGWWTGVQRFLRDAADPFESPATVRENVSCFVVTNVTEPELSPLFAGDPPRWRPADNRALVADTVEQRFQTVLPFGGGPR